MEQLVEAEREERQAEERVGSERVPAEDPQRPDRAEGRAAGVFVGDGEEVNDVGDEPTGPARRRRRGRAGGTSRGCGAAPRSCRHASRYRRLSVARAIATAA